MKMIDLMIKSNFKYTPSQDEWCEFWSLMRGQNELLDDNYINDIFLVWYKGKQPSPRQCYFLFKRVFPNAKLGRPPNPKNPPLRKYLDEQ